LNRDLREFGVNVPAQTLHRFWRMSAHLHGQLFNASSIASALGGISHTTVGRYLDSLVDTMMLRRREPHFVNVGKRLPKSSCQSLIRRHMLRVRAKENYWNPDCFVKDR
jgi:uncharacterized protein